MKFKRIVFAATAVILSSCAFFRLASLNLKPPSVTDVRCDVKDIGAERAKVEFVLAAYNPNTVGLKNVWISYELFSHGKRFLKGDSIKVNLAPKDTTPLVIPAEIVYREVFRVIGPMAEKALLGDKTLPIRIDAVVTGKPTLYNSQEEGSLISFTVKISRTEDVPIPQDQIDKAKDELKHSLRKMFFRS